MATQGAQRCHGLHRGCLLPVDLRRSLTTDYGVMIFVIKRRKRQKKKTEEEYMFICNSSGLNSHYTVGRMMHILR